MSPKLSLDLEDLITPQPKIGLVSNQNLIGIVYQLNQKFQFGLSRRPKGKDHSIHIKGVEYCFALFEGLCTDPEMPVYLLENRSFESIGSNNSPSTDLFSSEPDLIQAKLSKDKRKPDYFLLFAPEDESQVDMKLWTLHLGQIKGVLSAFEFDPNSVKEEENFILD
jgi:hypothetical protein